MVDSPAARARFLETSLTKPVPAGVELDLFKQHILPGVYNGVENDAYHAGPGISNTGLRNLARSPFHFYSRHMDPSRPPQAERAGQLDGTLAHCAVLEPLEFDRRYVVGPPVRANTNEWKAFVAANTRTVIKQEQRDRASAQARSLRGIPDVAELLSRGHAEQSVYWRESVADLDGECQDVLCRIRPDWVHPVNDDSVILLDVKTCGDASPREFAFQIRRKSYHCQNAFYTRGYEAATGKKVLAFVFAAVEDEWPFAASALMLDEQDVADGDAQNMRLLQLYVQCLRTDSWPCYTPSVAQVSIPKFGG
jgi:hypothetical protein